MTRVEFKLTMPSNNSWNGRWSGEERNYTLVKSMRNDIARQLVKDQAERSWSYSFGDGWVALVTARIIAPGLRLKKSDGFCGYEWMVDSILVRDRILADHQIKTEVSP